MINTSVNRDTNTSLPKACNFEETNSYVVDATGASVTADSSVGLIKQYCEKLPSDE